MTDITQDVMNDVIVYECVSTVNVFKNLKQHGKFHKATFAKQHMLCSYSIFNMINYKA